MSESPLYAGVLHFSLSDALHTQRDIEEYKYACYVIYMEKRFIWDKIFWRVSLDGDRDRLLICFARSFGSGSIPVLSAY